MEQYDGIDVSLELSSVCVVDATGKIRRELKVPSEPEALVRFFQQLKPAPVRIGWRLDHSPNGSMPVSSTAALMSCCWRPDI